MNRAEKTEAGFVLSRDSNKALASHSEIDPVSEESQSAYSLSEPQVEALNSPFKDTDLDDYLDQVDDYLDRYAPKISPLDFEPEKSIDWQAAKADEEDHDFERLIDEIKQVDTALSPDPGASRDLEEGVKGDFFENRNAGYPYRNGGHYEETPLGRMKINRVEALIAERHHPLVTVIWFLVAAGFVFLLGVQVVYADPYED